MGMAVHKTHAQYYDDRVWREITLVFQNIGFGPESPRVPRARMCVTSLQRRQCFALRRHIRRVYAAVVGIVL